MRSRSAGLSPGAKEALPDKQMQSSLWPSLALLAIFVMVWMLYGVISASPAAIHNDMAEAYVWGHEFQLGYEKHPPFWAWIAGLWFEVFPRADWAWTMHFFVRSIDDRRFTDAILFGLFIGLALLSKYFALILATTCFAAV